MVTVRSITMSATRVAATCARYALTALRTSVDAPPATPLMPATLPTREKPSAAPTIARRRGRVRGVTRPLYERASREVNEKRDFPGQIIDTPRRGWVSWPKLKGVPVPTTDTLTSG